MRTFKQYYFSYLNEDINNEDRGIAVYIGRFQPPTFGHKMAIKELKRIAAHLDVEPYVIIVDSGKRDKTNPLPGDLRKQLLQQTFPQMNFEIVKNAYAGLDNFKLQNRPVKALVAGTDRIKSYRGMVARVYDQQVANDCTFIELKRDPDQEGIPGISATRARESAMMNNLSMFQAFTGIDDATVAQAVMGIIRRASGDNKEISNAANMGNNPPPILGAGNDAQGA